MKLNSQKLKDYKSKNLDYKIQAHNILNDNLGYEPPLAVSILSELNLRSALKRYDNDDMTKVDLDNYIEFQVKFINRMMMENIKTFNC